MIELRWGRLRRPASGWQRAVSAALGATTGLVLLAGLALSASFVGAPANRIFMGLAVALHPLPPPKAPVALVRVGDDDLAACGGWPLRRDTRRTLVKRLVTAGARAVLVLLPAGDEAVSGGDRSFGGRVFHGHAGGVAGEAGQFLLARGVLLDRQGGLDRMRLARGAHAPLRRAAACLVGRTFVEAREPSLLVPLRGGAEEEPFPVYALRPVLDGSIGAAAFRDRLVVVGSGARGTSTPIDTAAGPVDALDLVGYAAEALLAPVRLHRLDLAATGILYALLTLTFVQGWAAGRGGKFVALALAATTPVVLTLTPGSMGLFVSPVPLLVLLFAGPPLASWARGRERRWRQNEGLLPREQDGWAARSAFEALAGPMHAAQGEELLDPGAGPWVTLLRVIALLRGPRPGAAIPPLANLDAAELDGPACLALVEALADVGLLAPADELLTHLYLRGEDIPQEVLEEVARLQRESPLERWFGSIKDELEASYEGIRVLGQGGMAFVFEAYERRAERAVALKALQPVYAGQADHVRRFLREARTLAELHHPNVVTVYDVHPAAVPYFTMEPLEGRDLSDLLDEEGPLDPQRAMAYADQFLDALAYVHGQGVLHRDVKPANLFVTKADRAVLVDFGLAKTSFFTSITRTGIALGTPLYMAPEQFRGAPADAKADVYGAGLTIFRMLAGRLPFDDSLPPPYYKRPWSTLAALRPALPRELSLVLERATSLDPATRYAEARAFREALAAAWRGGSGAAS